MEFLEQKKDENDYHELKKGTKLYRGDNRNIDVNEYKPRFFVKDIEHTKVYGKIIYEFSVKEDLKLLAIDKNIPSFYKGVPENIQTILKENYGYGYESRNRLSDLEKDNELLDYICNNTEYHGYAANEMPTQISHFDPEITICEPGEKLTTAKIISNLSEEDVKLAHAEARLIENEKERKEKKRKIRPDKQSSVSPIKFGNNNLFGDDDDDESDLKSRALFGEKRKTKKYWRHMKQSKKGRKTYKKKFGARCFLYPKGLKYPICHKKTGRVECKGLLAAHNRATLSVRRKLKPKKYSYKRITQKARKLGKKYRCKWVKSKKSIEKIKY